MPDQALKVGDIAPDFALMAAADGKVSRATLDQLLAGKRGLVLTTYVLDFTGG